MTRSTIGVLQYRIDSAKLLAVSTSKPASLRINSRDPVTLFSSSTTKIFAWDNLLSLVHSSAAGNSILTSQYLDPARSQPDCSPMF